MTNELPARYRARQPSETRRQANAESQRIRRQQETTEQSEARRQGDEASHHLLRERQRQAIQDQSFFSAESEVQMHYCGQKNIICQFCSP